jgi:thiamine kinase-like enzyme
MSDEKHEVLKGGRVTKNVVKIGETVRRPLTKNTNFVNQLLQYLEKVGFDRAPKFLGIDESNRQILSYIKGFVPPDLDKWSDKQLVTAAKLIRDYHDSTISFESKGTEEIICHNDLSPCNAVMIAGLPFGLIDFDAAAPGSRISDLAYATWMWCDLGNVEESPKEQGRRIKLMLDAYGLEKRQDFITEILEIQKKHIQQFKLNVQQGLLHWDGAIKWAIKCMDWIKMHKDTLEKEIS